MGKQFRFLMDEFDEKAFVCYVREGGKLFETTKNEGTFQIYDLPDSFWIKLFFSKDEFGEIVYKKIDGKQYIDTTISPVIEFRKTLLRENMKEIQCGRLFLETKYYDKQDKLAKKSEHLDSWYRELVGWIKKRLECIEIITNGKVNKEYVSKSFVKYMEDNYKLLG